MPAVVSTASLFSVAAMFVVALGWDSTGLDETVLLQAQVSKTRKAIEPVETEGVAPKFREPLQLEEQACVDVASASASKHLTPSSLNVTSEATMTAQGESKEMVASATQRDAATGPTTSGAIVGLRYVLLTASLLIFVDGCWRAPKFKFQRFTGYTPGSRTDNAAGAPDANLMHAAFAGDVSRCKALISLGADVREADVWGSTALHAAARIGSGALVTLLLDFGAELDAQDMSSETPLHIAARAGHAEVCEALAGCGADVNATNRQGWTPLVVAGHEGNAETCAKLRALKASVGDVPEDELPRILRPPAPETAEQDVQVDVERLNEAFLLEQLSVDVTAW